MCTWQQCSTHHKMVSNGASQVEKEVGDASEKRNQTHAHQACMEGYIASVLRGNAELHTYVVRKHIGEMEPDVHTERNVLDGKAHRVTVGGAAHE